MISERISQIFMYDIRDDIKYDIKHDIKVSLPVLKTGCIERCDAAVKVALCRFKCRLFKISDGDLAPSSTTPGSSSASDASRQAMCDIVCPSQSLSLDVCPPTMLGLSSSSSDRVGTGRCAGVAAPAPPAPAPGLFFWKLNTPPARIQVSDGHSNWI